MKQRSDGATVLLGMPEFVAGAQLAAGSCGCWWRRPRTSWAATVVGAERWAMAAGG